MGRGAEQDERAVGTDAGAPAGVSGVKVPRGRDEVRPEHRPAVGEELARLEATVARTFADSADLDRASAADLQGIGGRTRPSP